MIHDKGIRSGLVLLALLGAAPLEAGPRDPAQDPDQTIAQDVHQAQHDVDQAWELYHRAALGGTVASPALQAEIEEHLHEARTLVTQAYEAAEQGDGPQVQRLLSQVKAHTHKAIQGSKEQKQ